MEQLYRGKTADCERFSRMEKKKKSQLFFGKFSAALCTVIQFQNILLAPQSSPVPVSSHSLFPCFPNPSGQTSSAYFSVSVDLLC